MDLLNNRDELLYILSTMGVELPPKTKLSMEALDKKLSKALDLSQGLKIILKGTNSIEVSKLEEWKLPLFANIGRVSFAEVERNYHALRHTGGIPTPELYINPFYDLRQTLLSIGYAYDKGWKVNWIQDEDDKHNIVIRVINIYNVEERTPLVIVAYDTSSGRFDFRNPEYLLSQAQNTQRCKATTTEQRLLLKMLEGNEDRLPPNYRPTRLPFEKNFRLSFLLPLQPLNMVSVGMLTNDIGCVICGERTKAKCSQCHSASYCGKDCQRDDWPEHRKMCKSLSKGTWIDIPFFIVLRGTAHNRHDSIEGLRATLRSQIEAFSFHHGKNGSAFIGEDDSGPVPPNVHGDSAFLIKIQVPMECDRNSSFTSIMIYDRRRSFEAHLPVSLTDPAKYDLIEYTCRNKGVQGLKMYRWAKRIGDWKLAICLDREPAGEIKW